MHNSLRLEVVVPVDRTGPEMPVRLPLVVQLPQAEVAMLVQEVLEVPPEIPTMREPVALEQSTIRLTVPVEEGVVI